MKFIIAQGKRARKIVGPFWISASQEDMRILRDQIDDFLAEEIDYFWFFVQERAIDTRPTNYIPEPWDP